MESGHQTLLQQMKATSQLVEEMVQIKMLTLDAHGWHSGERKSRDGSLNFSAEGKETNVQSDVASDDQATSNMRSRQHGGSMAHNFKLCDNVY